MATRAHKKKTAATAKQAPIEVSRQNIKSPDYVSLYGNYVQVQTSPWDMRLILGSVSEPATRENLSVVITQDADVRISLQLAKRLLSVMAEQISEYEERFGPIPVMPEIRGD